MTAQKPTPWDRIKTGVKNLDALLDGGLPRMTVTLVGGTPGAGKTILTQQICFQNASPLSRVLFFQTLSEPTAKTLRYLSQFEFFDANKLEDGSVRFVDLGGIMRTKGLEEASSRVMDEIKKVKPAFVVIDSFKVFSDLAKSPEELRKFTYEMAINLMAWECTSFLLGEFTLGELQGTPLSSIVDGIMMLTSHELSGEQQRFLQVTKMRGTNHDRNEHTFSISESGIEIYSSRLEIRQEAGLKSREVGPRETGRCKTGMAQVDSLMRGGIPYGASVLVSGVAGTGKTVFCLEALYRGARQYDEKGIFVSFDETPEELIETARSLGWDLEREMKRGMIEVVYVPQADILVEKHLLMIRDAIERAKAKRVAIDSLSVFLHKIKDARIAREKIFQLISLIRGANAAGFLASDIPFGSGRISLFGIEEALVDAVVILTLSEVALDRQRFLEVYKLRNTDHGKGRHKFDIGRDGITLSSGRRSKKGKKK